VTWVSWRLQRAETLVALGILALLAALLVPTGIQMADAYHHDGLAACVTSNSPTCGHELELFQQRFQALTTLGNWFTLIPGLIGVLLAAPFILELEHGTHRLAWTQSITRGRWLVGKLGVAVVTAAVAAGALSLLLTWWRTPNVHINGRLDIGNYDTIGTVAIGYTLFALGLALALGAVWRRTAVSLVVAFIGYFAARIYVDYSLRDHLVSPLTATYRGAQQPHFLDSARVLSATATLHGHPVGNVAGGGSFTGGHVQMAAPHINDLVFHVVYYPRSDFWPLQLTETGLFAGIAALLIVFAAWWTHQRAA
jgi:hypothetical protein